MTAWKLHAQITTEHLLNGQWQFGLDKNYTGTTQVPGIPLDPTKMVDEKLWYKKEITLPVGNWQQAVLEFKGARFLPEVYINGELVSKQNGGMAHTFHPLKHAAIKPGSKVVIEIALTALKKVPSTDASYIPPPDQWRSNISSCLWDDVVLHVHGENSFESIVPFVDYDNSKASVKYHLNNKANGTIQLQVMDKNGKVLLAKEKSIGNQFDSIAFSYKNILSSWSPLNPTLYRLKLTLLDKKKDVSDEDVIPFGIKKIEVKDKQFFLNNQPCKVGGGTVVWHRWVRTDEGKELGYDTAWFHKNVIRRLKEHGANYLRFHLGVPPEKFLDMCDQYGLLVQYEWNFFHGMPASKESLLEQYKQWLDIAVKHPCVSFIHPYNETEGNELETVWNALNTLLPNYPSLVLEERDVMHIHKYWWSIFENLGLYYDTYRQFPKAVIIDEFGGNYLDKNGDLGAYVTVKESYLRFLGREHNGAQRLAHHAQANGKVAEYWRRIGAAGIAPFCILGSWNDGNNWFLGDLKDEKPMPVWNALTAAWSPQSVSIELWDRNFTPNQSVLLPVYFFNDVDKPALLKAKVSIVDETGKTISEKNIEQSLNAFSRIIQEIKVSLPVTNGNYTLTAELLNKPVFVKYPVTSSWQVHVFSKTVSANLSNIKIAVPNDEKEITAFLKEAKIASTSMDDKEAKIILTSINTWNKIQAGDKQLGNTLQQAIFSGKSVVMLDIGDRHLGQGYPEKEGELGPLQGVARVTDPEVITSQLFSGISVSFKEAAEPESHTHADKSNNQLWNNIQQEYTWLWNGLRAGLIVPASDMEFTGLNAKSFIAQWKAYGADESKIKGNTYYAYELQGFYEYSTQSNDDAVMKKLKDRVAFLVQDAPALAISINPNTAVKITDLTKGYKESQNGIAENLIPLVNAGKNLTRTPVVMIDFGKGKGKLIASQLLTKGRLAKGFGEKGLYGTRYDEVTVQMVLNMLSQSIL